MMVVVNKGSKDGQAGSRSSRKRLVAKHLKLLDALFDSPVHSGKAERDQPTSAVVSQLAILLAVLLSSIFRCNQPGPHNEIEEAAYGKPSKGILYMLQHL